MPPKKKKLQVNPIVVGTVSTRSTRRQSIVNIDIPKSKSKTKLTRCLKDNPDINKHATNLANQIRESYSRVLKNNLSKSISSPKADIDVSENNENFSHIPRRTTMPEPNQEIMAPKSIIRTSQVEVSTYNLDEAGCKNANDLMNIKNEAVREILEDWTDDESQDSKRKTTGTSYNRGSSSSSSSETERAAYFENLEFGAEDINEIIGDNFRSIKSNAAHVTDVNEIELTLLAGRKESELVSQKPANVDQGYELIANNSNNNIEESVSSCPVNEVISEPSIETFDDMLDCVTEEIVTESTEVDEIESNDSPNPNEQVVQESVLLEDTINSLSTNDSNDAEVQSFFSKEIENNQIVNKEDIPFAESSSGSTDQMDILDNKLQMRDRELSTLAEDNSVGNSNTDAFECSKSSSDNSVHKMSFASLNELRSTLENDSSEEVKTSEVDLKEGVENEFGMEVENNSLINDELLERQIADLKLQEPVPEDDIMEKVSELNIKVNEQSSENLKTSDGLLNARKGTDSFKTNTKKLLPRKTRTLEIKTPNVQAKREIKGKQPKPVNTDNSSKRKKTSLAKLKSMKDIKTKNKAEATKLSKLSKEKIGRLEKSDKKTDTDLEDAEVRRSSRIKSISVLKKKTSGHGLVRSKSEPTLNEPDTCDTSSTQTESDRGTPVPSPKVTRERKTRWSKSTENLSNLSQVLENKIDNFSETNIDEKAVLPAKDPIIEARLKSFVHLKENLYKTDRMTCKEAKKMTCDCFLTQEEVGNDEYGCGEDCLNRLLLIECGNLCQVGDRCTNKRFQKGQFAPVEVFNTDKKGLGLRAAANIPYGEFILEYVGEVLDSDEFDKRAEVYSQDKNIHYYFMALRADAIIDATIKGNISRFINHSCDPNAETQKWTVNGELRIGFFSTRTILAGEEVTFDYRFQRYGKEAQKCYCEAAICRGWLGEQPDEDSEDEEEEDEEEEEEVIEEKKEPATDIPSQLQECFSDVKGEVETVIAEATPPEKQVEQLHENDENSIKMEPIIEDTVVVEPKPTPVVKKKTLKKKKPRIELFEEIDQLNEEIEMLVTTGLKNQAHTLKLSRLMVRAKEPQQRTKLLRVLRRGELPCRRLFLDYHGLRLMHGYMIDVQHLVSNNKKFESLRLEVLQTLAVLPIPNKTMLQDSKVLLTVEKWATCKEFSSSPLDSDSNSPAQEQSSSDDPIKNIVETALKEEPLSERTIEDQEEEIRFLAGKLIEEWNNLKEVFRIPKKERIEQMKEHEREANKKFMQSGYANEQDKDKKSERYRGSSKYKIERDRKVVKPGDKPSAEFLRLSKIERRKLFALQHEFKEEERRMKQREMWRQHEVNCLMMGTDPRFTAPFDPNRGYQCIWNPQIGQWQNYTLPGTAAIFAGAAPTLPNLSVPPPQIPKSIPTFPYSAPMNINTNLNLAMPHSNTVKQAALGAISGITGGMPQTIPGGMPGGMPQNIPTNIVPGDLSQNITGIMLQNALGNIPGSIPQSIPVSQNITGAAPPIPIGIPQNISESGIPQQINIAHTQGSSALTASSNQYVPETVVKEEDPSQVKFMGPIPPPAKLPPKWKCAKDKYGRPYYYHIKIRKSQWEPPPLSEPSPPEEQAEFSESESSSDTSSLSSESSSENSDSDEDIDDTKLLLEVRKQMEKSTKPPLKLPIPDNIKPDEDNDDEPISSPEDQCSEMDVDSKEDITANTSFADEENNRPSIDIRLKEFNFLKDDSVPRKKRRVGLCEERLISPRSEEDKLQFKEDVKRYKANKEKLKRQKELMYQQAKNQMKEIELKKIREKKPKVSLKVKIKDMPDFNSEAARKIKETFRSNMASTVVGSLNVYRKPDCKEGRITNTEDFKHLARKLTHFVMLKEMKHIARIEDLTCTDNVKVKAREYIKKYMSKFGEVYIKRTDSPDFKD